MMRLRQFLKNTAKSGLSILIISPLIYGCSSSTSPTYIKENIEQSIQDICRNEYRLDVKARLTGSTLWVYIPIEDIFVKSDKPEKYLERFTIETNKEELKDGVLKLEYLVKPIPEEYKFQDYRYNKAAIEKMNNVWKVLRRVIFSMDRKKAQEPKFFVLVTADIKNGFEIEELFYYLDLKKVSYEFISWGEYQHRSIQDMNIAQEIIQDKEGTHLKYEDITFDDFICRQIQHRIRLKFQKPEVAKGADIDKEILKAVIYTVKTYGFDNFSAVELRNLLTKNNVILNRAAVRARFIE